VIFSCLLILCTGGCFALGFDGGHRSLLRVLALGSID